MKNRIFQIILGLSIITFSGCFNFGHDFDCIDGNNKIVTEEFDLDDFSEIVLDIDADIKLKQGNKQSVEVEGQENIIDNLELDVRNDRLVIDFDECIDNHDKLMIFITIPEINFLSIRGSGEIKGENVFDVKDLELKISGSGDMDLGLQADDVEGKITGSGSVKLDGDMDKLIFKITGSGDLAAFDLICNEAEVSISGSGDAEVNVKDDLEVNITGSGDVFFKGDPKLNVHVTGSGEVIDAN